MSTLGNSLAILIVTATCCFASASCKTSCDAEDNSTTTISDGVTNEAGTSYQSVEWDGHFLNFPPQKEYVFEHHLRDTPTTVMTYLAFSPCPLAPKGSCADDPTPSGEVAAGAGDVSVISDVGERSFTVRNNTCETFSLRVTAWAEP